MSEKQSVRDTERDRYIGIGMTIGMLLFAPVGLVLFITTDNPGLMGVGPAIGLSIGLAIGDGLYQRHRQKEGSGR